MDARTDRGARSRLSKKNRFSSGWWEKSPEDYEVPSALWTRQAVAELIEKKLGIKMPIRTVGEYLNRWGFTPQKPKRKSYKQDPEEVRRWLEEEYPAIERRAAAENAEIHWGDETGVRSTCQVGRGYAPKRRDAGAESGGRSIQR